jgi:hypothetical protein
MRVSTSILSFIFTFSAGCGLGAAPQPLNTSAAQFVVLSAEKDQPSEAFPRELQYRRAKRTSSAIKLAPQSSEISSREMKLAWGKLPVLSIPIAITNSSAREISMNLSHEWYGGIWPLTDLYVAVQPNSAKGGLWSDGPGYRVGEEGSANSLVILRPGEKKTFDIRLNWPGTGSMRTEPLIDASKPGKYSIKFLLFFKAGGSEEYVESQAANIEVQK